MFSWSAGKKSSGNSSSTSTYPAQRTSLFPSTAAARQPGFPRNEHLGSYLNDQTLKPSTRRVSKDDTTYDTVFQTKAGHALILRVHLPPNVPNAPPRAPAMTLVGVRATHPWLDNRMRVTGYDPISTDEKWASSGLLLGKAVGTIVQHLQLNPPHILEITDQSLQRIQATIQQQQQQPGQQQPGQQQPGQQQPGQQHLRQPSQPPQFEGAPPDYESLVEAESERNFHMPIPAVPSSFPELETMSRSDMRELLDNEEKFKAYVDKMSAVTTLNDLKQSIFKGNVESAESNLKHEEELSALHAEVSALRDSLREKVAAFRELEARQAELCTPPDKRDVVKKLTTAKRDAFNESEELASDWVDNGDMSIDEFVEKFVERRTIHHVRAAKIERLNATM